jgi:tRNA pseudouridine55 synthase
MAVEASDGLFVIHKPSGITSHDVIVRLRSLLPLRRLGHCGTLDPMASGVLLVVGDKATRHQESLMRLEKQYWFRALLGKRSDTGDRDGRPLPAPPWAGIDAKQLEEAANLFVGEQWQWPPRYAALKYKGRPYYTYARLGQEIPRAPRTIQVSRFESLSFKNGAWEGRVLCSKGTYVRTLVEDVAEHLGTAAILDALVRERIGPYTLADAASLESRSFKASPFPLPAHA